MIVDADAELAAFFEGSNALPAMELLPADVPFVVGLGLDKGWATRLMEAMDELSGPQRKEFRAGVSAIEDMVGANPEKLVEQALGDSAALVFGNGLEDKGEMALVITGDVDEIEGAIEKISDAAPPQAAAFFETSSNDDVVVLGPVEEFRKDLLDGGGFTDSDEFKRALPDADDAAMTVYIDMSFEPFARGFLSEFSRDEAANLEKLSSVGIAQWQEGERSVTVLRVVVDD